MNVKTNIKKTDIFKLVYQLTSITLILAINIIIVIYLFYQLPDKGNNTNTILVLLVVSILVLVFNSFVIFYLYKSLKILLSVLDNVLNGDMSSRTNLEISDQLGILGIFIDKILDQRVDYELTSKEENQSLNNAVVSLLHGVNKLSQKDLTARVEITEDATAPIADSLNILADEISRVLLGVRSISNEISSFSHNVKNQSDIIVSFATTERDEVERANAELITASKVMKEVAELANKSSVAADEAIESTSKAKNIVINTVESINNIREVIRETEKRIKRLGERSQEISSVVNLINSIAERTHILALNASIHAASTGEAGKGFVVIADEVQRLAENAREATSEISSLVNNIQLETNDTVRIMNNVISEVVNGTKLAQAAETQMQETMSTTNQLVNMVQQIKSNSDEQRDLAVLITERAASIKESTLKTNKELQQQSVYADKLVEFTAHLVDAVGVFILPNKH